MSNALEDLRAELQDAMNVVDLDAHLVTPEIVSPPATFVGPGSPYVSLEGANIGCVIVRHEIVLAVGVGVNEVNAAELDRRFLAALAALPGHYAVEGSFTGQVPLNGQQYLGGVLSTLTEIQIPEPEENP